MYKFLFLSLFLPSLVFGQSLNDLVSVYLKNSPEISQLKSTVKEKSAQYTGAKRAFLPSITLKGQAKRQEIPTLIPFFVSPDKSYSAFAELYQPVYSGGKIRANLEGRKLEYGLSKKQLIDSKNKLVMGFVSDVLDFKTSKQLQAILKKSEQTAKNFLRTTKSRHKRGGARNYELAQAQSQLYSYSPRILNSSITINNLKTKILINTGLSALDDKSWDWEEVPSIDHLLLSPKASEVKEARVDYSALVAQKKIAKSHNKMAMAEFKPSVNITGQWGYQTNSSKDVFKSEYESQNIALNVSVPLFSGFRRSVVKQAGQSNLMGLDSQLKQYSQVLDADLKQSMETLVSSEKNLKNTRDWKLRSKRALDGAKKDFKKGLLSQNEIVQLQAAYEVAATGHLNSLKGFYLAKMNREFILGLNLVEIYSGR